MHAVHRLTPKPNLALNLTVMNGRLACESLCARR